MTEDGSREALRICPRCCGRLVKNGYFRLKDGSRHQRYRCRQCGRSCNVYTGTLRACLKKRNQWLQMEELMKQTLSLRQVAALLGIHLSTAFRWRHRWMAARLRQPQPVLTGRVCASVTAIPYSEKGSRTCYGPGSWGYWNFLRRGLRPAWMPRQEASLPRFRRFLEGRPTRILVLQDSSSCATYILGQGAPDEDILAYAIGKLVAKGGKVYDFSGPTLKEACELSGHRYRKGWHVLHRWRRQRNRRKKKGLLRTGIPIGAPAVPNPWLAHFRGVATRYLERYLGWFCFLVSLRLQNASA